MAQNKMTAMLVDDSKLSRNLLKHYIFSEYADVDIFEESNGADALKTYYEKKPHLTFLDLTMPGMNGFEFLKKVKEVGKAGEIAVLSADAQEVSRNSAMALGADYFIQKPIKTQLAKINGIVNHIRSKLGVDTVNLTEWQKSFLGKVFQQATTKAAETLGAMTGSPVRITVPDVAVVDRANLGIHIKDRFDNREKLMVLRQAFSGNFHGYAFLVFRHMELKEIASLIDADTGETGDSTSQRDSVLEIANILIGSCVGAFGNTVEMPLTLYPPTHAEGDLSIVEDTSSDAMLMRYALVAKAGLVVQDKGVERDVAIIISISSMKVLMAYLDEMLRDAK